MRALRVISAAAGVALAAGMGLGVPAAATAATAAPAAVAHAAAAASAVRGAGVTVDVNNFIEFSGSGESGASAAFGCFEGTDYPMSLATVKSVRNNCEFRVFLVYAGGSPGPNCVSPKTTRDVSLPSFQHPDGVNIGTGTSACPDGG